MVRQRLDDGCMCFLEYRAKSSLPNVNTVLHLTQNEAAGTAQYCDEPRYGASNVTELQHPRRLGGPAAVNPLQLNRSAFNIPVQLASRLIRTEGGTL